MGRSRGGLTTKIHTLVDTRGRPVRFILTPGQAADINTAPHLLEGRAPAAVIADKAYDSNGLRQIIADMHAQAVIPSIASRKLAIPHDRTAYRLRNRIERFFNTLKHFRRIATRYDRRATYFLAAIHAACICIALR